MLRIFKGVVHGNALTFGCLEALLHDNAMRNDVDTPFFEVSNLVLCFAYDDFDNRRFHPRRLTTQIHYFLANALHLIRISDRADLCLQLSELILHLQYLRLPTRLSALEHAATGDFVDTYKHGLAGFPPGRAMVDEIVR